MSSIGTVSFETDAALVSKEEVAGLLATVKQALQELTSSAFTVALANTTNLSVAQGDVESDVWVELTEESALNLNEAPLASQVPAYLESVRVARCGQLGTDKCDVQEPNSKVGLKAAYESTPALRLRRLQGYQLPFVVFAVIAAAEDMATMRPLEDPSFITKVVENVANSLPDAEPPSSLAPVQDTARTVVSWRIPEAAAGGDVPLLQEHLLESSAIAQEVEAAAAANGMSNSSIMLGQPEVDLCRGRTCSDHGLCVQGVCQCSGTWTGVNCGVGGFVEEVATATTTAPTLGADSVSLMPSILTVRTSDDDNDADDWETVAIVCFALLGLGGLSALGVPVCFSWRARMMPTRPWQSKLDNQDQDDAATQRQVQMQQILAESPVAVEEDNVVTV